LTRYTNYYSIYQKGYLSSNILSEFTINFCVDNLKEISIYIKIISNHNEFFFFIRPEGITCVLIKSIWNNVSAARVDILKNTLM